MKNSYLFICLLSLIVSAKTIKAQTLDVLVVLSTDIIGNGTNGLGSETAARDRVAMLIEQANGIYAVDTTANLFMVGEITIPEDVSNLTSLQQVQLLQTSPIVQDARNRYGADLVTLFASNGSDSNIVGRVFGIPSSSDAQNIPVLEDDSLSMTRNFAFPFDRFTYAHEVGHSLGLAHNVSSAAWENYSHGFSFFNSTGSENRHTVVASPAGNDQHNHRIAFLSNPNRTYTETPFFSNVNIGTALNDNARTMMESAGFIDNINSHFIFFQSSVLDQEWRWFSWWGVFTTASFPWEYHLALDDWLFVDSSSTSTEDLFLFSSNKNYWLWTTSSLWPQVFNFFDNTWCDIFSTCP